MAKKEVKKVVSKDNYDPLNTAINVTIDTPVENTENQNFYNEKIQKREKTVQDDQSSL